MEPCSSWRAPGRAKPRCSPSGLRNKAANEMRTRVEEETGGQSAWSRTATFHAFATDLLRQHGSHVGLKPNFTLLTSEDERLEVLDEAMLASSSLFEAEPPDRRAVLSLFERLCAEGYTGEDMAPLLSHTPGWLPGLFRQYNDLLVRLGPAPRDQAPEHATGGDPRDTHDLDAHLRR